MKLVCALGISGGEVVPPPTLHPDQSQSQTPQLQERSGVHPVLQEVSATQSLSPMGAPLWK